jgi:hypothetical protein
MHAQVFRDSVTGLNHCVHQEDSRSKEPSLYNEANTGSLEASAALVLSVSEYAGKAVDHCVPVCRRFGSYYVIVSWEAADITAGVSGMTERGNQGDGQIRDSS